MTFDWFRRFRKPEPTREARGQHHPPRLPMIGKRPAPPPQVHPQVRRAHQHQSMPIPVPVPRSAAPPRKIHVARPPARPHPPQRGPSKSLQCFRVNFHPGQKRDLVPAHPSKRTNIQQVPPFPPPRGAPKPPPRHVHWAPAQAPLPDNPYPYPYRASYPYHAHSQVQPRQYRSPPPPSYQLPRPRHGSQPLPYRIR